MIYVIFFHVTGLAVIEILFYFYYIGPMEHKVFKSTLSHTLQHQNIIQIGNISQLGLYYDGNATDYMNKYVMDGEAERNESNINLFHRSLIALSVIISISIFVCIIENVIKYKRKEMVRNRSSHNIIIEIANLNDTDDNLSAISTPMPASIEENKHYERMYLIFLSFGKIILMSSLIIGFEYWFFNYIVLKYKIISQEEMEFLLLQSLNREVITQQ